jgi:hypothetical protein
VTCKLDPILGLTARRRSGDATLLNSLQKQKGTPRTSRGFYRKKVSPRHRAAGMVSATPFGLIEAAPLATAPYGLTRADGKGKLSYVSRPVDTTPRHRTIATLVGLATALADRG